MSLFSLQEIKILRALPGLTAPTQPPQGPSVPGHDPTLPLFPLGALSLCLSDVRALTVSSCLCPAKAWALPSWALLWSHVPAQLWPIAVARTAPNAQCRGHPGALCLSLLSSWGRRRLWLLSRVLMPPWGSFAAPGSCEPPVHDSRKHSHFFLSEIIFTASLNKSCFNLWLFILILPPGSSGKSLTLLVW